MHDLCMYKIFKRESTIFIFFEQKLSFLSENVYEERNERTV